MNADMLNRGTEDRTSLSFSLSLFFQGGAERPIRPPLDSPLQLVDTLLIVQHGNIYKNPQLSDYRMSSKTREHRLYYL
jgi:hypothetical protein